MSHPITLTPNELREIQDAARAAARARQLQEVQNAIRHRQIKLIFNKLRNQHTITPHNVPFPKNATLNNKLAIVRRAARNARNAAAGRVDASKNAHHRTVLASLTQRIVGGDSLRPNEIKQMHESRRHLVKSTVAHLYEAADNVSSASKHGSIVAQLQRKFQADGVDMIVRGVLLKQRRATQVAQAAKEVAKWGTMGACQILLGRSPMAPLVKFALMPLALYAQYSVANEVEQKYAKMMQHIVGPVAEVGTRALTAAHAAFSRTPVAWLIQQVASKLGRRDCVFLRAVGMCVRALVNQLVQHYAGIELDYVEMAKVLLKHQAAVRGFLDGQETSIKGLLVSLVDAVPDESLKAVLDHLNEAVRPFTETRKNASTRAVNEINRRQ